MRLPPLTMAMVMAIAMGVTGIPRRRIDSRDGRIGPGLRMSIMGILMGMMMGIMNESLDIIVIIIIIESMVCLSLSPNHACGNILLTCCYGYRT